MATDIPRPGGRPPAAPSMRCGMVTNRRFRRESVRFVPNRRSRPAAPSP